MVAPAWEMVPFPRVLQALPQWIGYRLVWKSKEKKPDKVPTNPRSGGLASTTNPETWTTLPNAKAGVQRYELDGLGFVFTAADPFCGVDFDGVRDPETGEIQPDIWRDVMRLGSYTEVSVSGTGLHVICQGMKPDGSGNPPCEMYSAGRYFTMSGKWVIGTPQIIMPNSRGLEDLHRRRVAPERMIRRHIGPPPTDTDWTRGGLIVEGGRNLAMFRLGSKMRACGLESDEIETQLMAANEARCKPPLSHQELLHIVRSVSKYPAGQTA